MDKEIEIKRKINYVADLVVKTDQAMEINTDIDYYEYYQNYMEVVGYLIRSNEKIDSPIPRLIKPSFFNRQLGVVWTVAVLGIINPYVTIILLTMFFPFLFPYLIIRGITLTRTKNRIDEARLFLVQIVNQLKEQKIEMTGCRQ